MQMPRMDGGVLAAKVRSDPRFAGTWLVCVSSVGLPEGGTQAAGFDLTMTKPVRQAVVHDVLMQLAGKSEPVVSQNHRSAPGTQLNGLRVLLAEDNAVNRNVAVGMMALLGVEVSVAQDGQQAIEQLAKSDFDLVLMDCQMPIVDGFEATRRIRADRSPNSAVTIVAMTANAMAGDRELCISAGMDDYIAKPFTLDQLTAVLSRWAEASTPAEPTADPESESLGVVNEGALHELMDIMGGQLDDLLDVFESESPQLISDMEDAVRGQDAAGLRRAAHSLKSSAAVFGATELSAGAAAIEASTAPPEELAGAVARIRSDYTASVSTIRSLVSHLT